MRQLIERRADGRVVLRPIGDEHAFQSLADFTQADKPTGTPLQASVVLQPQDDLRVVRHYFDRLRIIAVHFPAFTDGRGFSVARMLRQLGWQGLLRATGELLPDQWLALIRVGFDQVEVEQATEFQVMRMVGMFSSNYQPHHPLPGVPRI